MKFTIEGRYRSGSKIDMMGRNGRWETKKDKVFTIEVSRFSEIFEQREFPMMPIPSGAGSDSINYRLSKDGTGVVMDQKHFHSTKPVVMNFIRSINEITINGKPPKKDMLDKVVQLLKRKHG